MPDSTELPEPLRALEARYGTSSYALNGLTWRVLDAAGDSQVDRVPVVMLPGALGSHKIFYRQWEFLQNAGMGRRLVLVDYPGSSLGACWLQILTSSGNLQLTQRVEHLLIGNTFVDAEPLQKSPLFARSLVNDKSATEVKRVFHEFVLGMPECELRTVQIAFMAEQSADDLANRLKMVANAGVIACSSVPQDRMTILSCEDDGVTTKEIAERVCKSYPRARHVAFSNGGHYPHVNRAEQYNKLLAEILREH